jgi:hypothetical protein
MDDIVAHRISGLALSAAREALEPGDPILDDLRRAQLRGGVRSAMVEGHAAQANAALDRMKIPYVVTKGPGIASLYPNPAWRPFRDIDVLVRPRDFRRAMEVFETLGFAEHASLRQPRGYFDRFCREAVNLLREDGAAIDLHHHVPPWIWGKRIGVDHMIRSARICTTKAGPFRTAAPVDNLLVGALHIISDRGRIGYDLLMWRDLATLAAACDPEEAVARANATGLGWILAIVLEALPPYAQPAGLVARLGRPRAPHFGRVRLRRLVPPARLARHQIARAFRYPVPNAIAFLYGFGFPSGEFLRRRYGARLAYGEWWRDALSGLRSAARTGDRRAGIRRPAAGER